jgi:hypothetical protein
VKRLIVLVGFVFAMNASLAQDAVPESGWKGSLRPLLTKILGAETTVKLIGAAPAPEGPAEMALPT